MNAENEHGLGGIPPKMVAFLDGAKVISTSEGRLDATILHIQLPTGRVYVKRASDWLARQEIDHEAEILPILSLKIEAPPLIAYGQTDEVSCLIIGELPGEAAHRLVFASEDILARLVLALKRVREVHTAEPRIPVAIDRELQQIQCCLSRGEIDAEGFATANHGRTPDDVFQELLNTRGHHRDDVFTHGDMCLPNVILADERIGLVDWGKSGWGDPMRDIYSLTASVRRNLGELAAIEFWRIATREVTGDLGELSEKVEFYQKVDQFFYNRVTRRN